MEIKNCYLNISSTGVINNNGNTGDAYTLNSLINIYINTNGKTVIRQIQISNTGSDNATIQILRNDPNGNSYFTMKQILSSGQYLQAFSGYSVLNQDHIIYVKSDKNSIQVNISLIQL